MNTLRLAIYPTRIPMFNAPWATLVTAFLLLSAGSAGAQQRDPANLERVEVAGKKAEVSRWFRAESQSFVVYSDTREEDVALLLDNLEKLDGLMRIYTLPARQAERQEPKLTLYYPSRLSDLREIDDDMPADAIGLYSSCASGVQGFSIQLERLQSLEDGQLEKAPLNDSLSYVFEAYARHFLYRHTDVRGPAWFMEGFAQYFSSVRFSERQMVVGRVPRAIGNYLRFLGNGRRYGLEWEDVLEQRLGNAHSYAGDAGVRLEFEAKSWLLMHYALSSDDNRKRLSQYLQFVDSGASAMSAFERAFGVKRSDLDQTMWRYGLRGLQVQRVVLPSLPAARTTFRTLPRAAGEFVLLDAAMKSCPGPKAGESLLKKVAALVARYPEVDRARFALGRAQVAWGDPREALSGLKATPQGGEAGFEGELLTGMARLRLAEQGEGDARRSQLQVAKRHLQRATELDSRSQEAALASFRAEVAAEDEPDDVAVRRVISAWLTSRDVDALTRYAALAYAYVGEADQADRTLGSLARSARNPPLAQWARQWQRRLETGVSRREILAEMRRPAPFDLSAKEWTLDKDGVMQKVELGYGLESAASFIKEQQAQQRNEMPPATRQSGGPGR